MNFRKETIEKILAKNSGERAIIDFFKKNKEILITAFCISWNYKICIPEFRLGNDFKCDFIILCADSRYWTAILIELESPSSNLYLKNGTPSKTLRIAQRQISDWKEWIRLNEDYFRKQLANYLGNEKVSAQCSRADIHTWAETEIIDKHTLICYEYKIIIGRRASLSKFDQSRRINEITYDRLITVAQKLDEFDKNYKNLPKF